MDLAGSWVGLVAAMSLMGAVWLWSLVRRDVSVIDAFWGPGFAWVAWTYHIAFGASGWRSWLVAVLVTVWGVRLGLHIYARNHGRGEDPRYAAMRARSPRTFAWTSLVTVFGLQALLLWIIAWPLYVVQRSPGPTAVTPWDVVGAALWLTGFLFESIGDAQLARFKRDPANRGRVMDRGLWAWTRHPNYFGDSALWWGFGAFALSVPGGALALVGPALMMLLLMRVSGVSLLERHMRARPGYDAYVARTSAFFPRPPRTPAS